MQVLKWGVPGTSQRSLQTVKQAGAEECSQPQWGAAGARPGIGGLPTARSKGLPIQPVTQNLSTEKDLSPVSVVVLNCWNNRLKFENKTTLALAPCRSCDWRADPLREIAESFLRSESTYWIQDLPLRHLLASWYCWVPLPLLSSHYVGGCQFCWTLPTPCPSTPQRVSKSRGDPPLTRDGTQCCRGTEQWYHDLLSVCQRVHLLHPQKLVSEEHWWHVDDSVQLCEDILVSLFCLFNFENE